MQIKHCAITSFKSADFVSLDKVNRNVRAVSHNWDAYFTY